MAKEISEEEKNHIQDMINGLVERAKKASEEYLKLDQEQVDEIIKQMSMAGLEHHMELAKMAVEETGRGIYEDKITKNMFATEYIYHSIKYDKTVGVISENEATINIPIARSTKDRKKMAVSKDGKNAITHFKVLKRYDKYTLVEVKIETGRTHQIRVHMSHIGYPVVGDVVYSNGKNPFGVIGQMLHAQKLTFKHPITNEELNLEAPLPTYFIEVLNKFENE